MRITGIESTSGVTNKQVDILNVVNHTNPMKKMMEVQALNIHIQA